jgi:hypothetical protein
MYNIGKLGITEKKIGINVQLKSKPVETVARKKKVSHNYLEDEKNISFEKPVETVELVGEDGGGKGFEKPVETVEPVENNKVRKGGVIRKKWDGSERAIECRYRWEKRPTHPAVCEWHRMEMDEVCRESKCPRMSLGWGGG